MRHVDIALAGSDRGNLVQRLTGRFYTPPEIACRLADWAESRCPNADSICDPFCGDGRLIIAWLDAASRRSGAQPAALRRILVWDHDSDAVATAKARVEQHLRDLGWDDCHVLASSGDTFERARTTCDRVQVVLTNPPWELLKPDSRDRVSVSSTTEYVESLRGYSRSLADNYPGALSERGKAMAGYGVNLARAGAGAAAKLVRHGGLIAIVLPSTIFADQASAPFRRHFFGVCRIEEIEWYPAESRLFAGVDQSFVVALGAIGEPTNEFRLTRFDRTLSQIESRLINIEANPSAALAVTVNGSHAAIADSVRESHPRVSDFENDMRYGLWLGRELDETRLSEVLTAGDGVPFLKGRSVFPYRIQTDAEMRIDPLKRSIPATVRHDRLAWRDVSRPTQRRRMHVALVPNGHVTGNSLGVAYFRFGPLDNIRVLLAVFNSLVFELQVRTLLSTAHVSQGVLRRCSIPRVLFENAKTKETILALTSDRMESDLELPALEVEVARAYGISRDAFAEILGAFPKLDYSEQQSLLRKELWS